TRRPPLSSLFPYPTLFRSPPVHAGEPLAHLLQLGEHRPGVEGPLVVIRIAHGAGLKVARPEVFVVARDGRRRQLAPNDEYFRTRSEEHTSELQSRGHLVCR